jgi:hypothetical protein
LKLCIDPLCDRCRLDREANDTGLDDDKICPKGCGIVGIGSVGCTAFHADAEYCIGLFSGTNPLGLSKVDMRIGGGKCAEDRGGENIEGRESSERVRFGCRNATGICGGRSEDLKMPKPIGCTGKGA